MARFANAPRQLRRACAVVAVLAAVATPASAAPAPATTTYTVSAGRSAWVEVSFPRKVAVETARTVVSGSGSYAGYLLQPIDGPGDGGFGLVLLNGVATKRYAPAPIPLGGAEPVNAYVGREPPQLPAARYRLHVFGDAATTVRLVLRGAGPSRTLRATRPSAFRGVARDVTPKVAGQPGAAAATAEIPFRVSSARSVTVVALFAAYHSAGTMTGTYNACLSPRGGVPCHTGPYVPGNAYYDSEYSRQQISYSIPIPLTSGAVTFAGYYTNGAAILGERTASYVLAFSAVMDRFAVAVFSLDY